jgi:hypothetical protein
MFGGGRATQKQVPRDRPMEDSFESRGRFNSPGLGGMNVAQASQHSRLIRNSYANKIRYQRTIIAIDLGMQVNSWAEPRFGANPLEFFFCLVSYGSNENGGLSRRFILMDYQDKPDHGEGRKSGSRPPGGIPRCERSEPRRMGRGAVALRDAALCAAPQGDGSN